jgi:tetratricopeptide (TPR) repeat protein
LPIIDNFQKPAEIDQLKAKLASNPEDFDTLSALGDLYFESSRYLEAIQTYDKALGVNPVCADCLNDKGLALFYSGDPSSALVSFDRAIAMAPAYTRAWLSKGYVLVSIGRYQEAIVPLNKVKELDSNGRLAAEADKFLAVVAQRGFN